MAQRPVTSLPRLGVLAAAVVLAVVLARARAAGVTPPPPDATREVLRSVLQVVTITLLVAAVVLLAGARGRRVARWPPGGRRSPKQTAADRRRTLVALLIGLSLALIGHVVGGMLNDPAERRAEPPPPAGEVRQSPARDGQRGPGEDEPSGLADTLVLAVLLAAMGAAGVALLRGRGTESDEPFDEPDPDDEAGRAAIARAVRAGRDAVRDTSGMDPRQAIVACFATMEDALRDRGEDAAPRPADTPQEVLTRGIAHARLPEAPARALLQLFREAQFSTHPMSEADRTAADRALTELLAGLTARAGGTAAC